MRETTQALNRLGYDARPWRPWEDDWNEFDVLHLFGSFPGALPLVEAARARGVRTVLSPIAWFHWQAGWDDRPWRARALAGSARHLIRSVWPGLTSWRRRLYHRVDLLLPNSQQEAGQLSRLFEVPRARLRVVFNGADPRFGDADPRAFLDWAGVRDFVLVAGRIEPRKNQLGLLQSLCGSGLPLVILGDVVPGCESYFVRCRRAADGNTCFLPALDHGDPRLASAYAACRCLVLPSRFETPGLAALEAALTGTPLVLPQEGSAREYFGPLARYVAWGDRRGLRTQVEQAYASPRNAALARLVEQQFTWEVAGRATGDVYDEIAAN